MVSKESRVDLVIRISFWSDLKRLVIRCLGLVGCRARRFSQISKSNATPRQSIIIIIYPS